MQTKPPESLLFFADLIRRELGIIYQEENYFQLQNRLEDAVRFFGLNSVDALYQKTREGLPSIQKQFILDISTNNETSFFRDPRVFQGIEKKLIPELCRTLAPNAPLRIWSAACASGQEVYSLQMLLHDSPNMPGNWSLTATDVSARMIDRAKQGRFSQLEIQRGLPLPMMLKHFTKDDQDFWSAKETLRKHVSFDIRNLKHPMAFPSAFHLILCRNVLIYQTVEAKAEIIDRLTQHLQPGGYLVLGAGESLLGISNQYQQEIIEGAVFHRRK